MDRIYFRDEPFFEWDFKIPFEYLNDNDLGNVYQDLLEFYSLYIDVSQKYNIGEIIPIPYINELGIDLKTTYSNLCNEHLFLNDQILIFPLSNVKETTLSKTYSNLHPGSTKYMLKINDEVVFDYFNIQKNKLHKLKKENYSKLYLGDANFQISSFGGDIINFKNSDFELGFTICCYSEFWFDKTFYGTTLKYENGAQNLFYSTNNTPRLNSYFRDLKEIWTNKFNWKFELSKGWYGVDGQGILSDGNVVYLAR